MTNQAITDIQAQPIFDSRGNPTVMVKVTAAGQTEAFSVPSGASTGKHESLELRDKNPKAYNGKGVDTAVDNVNQIIKKELLGLPVDDQTAIDAKLHELDQTDNFNRLGANAALGVSVACAKVAAKINGLPLYVYLNKLLPTDSRPQIRLPYIFANLINGGQHAPMGPAIQEYQVIPITRSIKEAVAAIFAIQNEIPKYLAEENQTVGGTGDEGGYVIAGKSIDRPLEILWAVATSTGYDKTIKLGIDAAANSFYNQRDILNPYQLDEDRQWTRSDLSRWYQDISNSLPILSIEDPFFEEDFGSFQSLHSENPELIVIGDDLTVTNPKRIQTAINTNAINGIIIKPNQIGTLSDTMKAITMCNLHNIKTIISHRSGETNDSFIADLAVGVGAYGAKIGALKHGERVVKYNRLLEIENELDR